MADWSTLTEAKPDRSKATIDSNKSFLGENSSLTEVAAQVNQQGTSNELAKMSAAERLWDGAQDSFKYTLTQSPITGVAQVIDHVAKTDLAHDWKFYDQKYRDPEFGSAEWFGTVAGSVGATALQMGLLYRFVGPGAAAKFETSANYGVTAESLSAAARGTAMRTAKLEGYVSEETERSLSRARFGDTVAPSVGKSMATGAVIGGVFTPTSDDAGSFVGDRLEHAGFTALAFGLSTGLAVKLKTIGNPILRNDAMAATVAGAAAGEVNTDGRALLTTGRIATTEERLKGVFGFALGGTMGGALNEAHEFIAPTNGIRGVRTLDELTKLADATRVENPRQQFEIDSTKIQSPKAEILMQKAEHEKWQDKLAVSTRQIIDESDLPLEHKKLLQSGIQEMAVGLFAINGIKGDMAATYGSARTPEHDWRFQLARLTVGTAAKELDLNNISGGGNGIMKAADKGAYEAGKEAVGALIDLKWEQGNLGNGFQTLTLKFRNFHTRMEILKKVKTVFSGEPGIGTAAETMDTLTHMQTGKLDRMPVILIGTKVWKPMDDWLKVMEKRGNISPEDRNLYIITDDPRKVPQLINKWGETQMRFAAERAEVNRLRQARAETFAQSSPPAPDTAVPTEAPIKVKTPDASISSALLDKYGFRRWSANDETPAKPPT